MVDGSTIRRTADVCTDFLGRSSEADWSVSIPDLDWSVAAAVAHAAEGCLWYAIDLAAGGKDLDSVEHRVKIDSSPGELIETLTSFAGVVASVVEVSSPSTRGFHPMGPADPSGFAAMACDELLIHTDDAARGLGVVFDPPPELAGQVLGRLFPWVSPTGDVWQQLRWANGRVGLADHPRLIDWAWHCAPIDEWDGTVPAPPSRPPAS